jgi:hypothetical protein
MNRTVIVAVAGVALMGSPSVLISQDGAGLYKTKCSACPGANGEGRPAMHAPALKGTTVGRRTDRTAHH